MSSLITAAKAFVSDEDGITAIEYGLIAATMVTVVITAFTLLGPALDAAFGRITAKIIAA